MVSVTSAWANLENTRVVFERAGDIFVTSFDGTGETNLTNSAAAESAPNWSPDGTKIAYISDVDGSNDVFVMNADGSGASNVTTTPADKEANVAWSPDGSQFVLDVDIGADGTSAIYTMSNDGSGRTALTGDADKDARPAWSSDGAQIVFQSERDTPGFPEIYVMNADGSAQTRRTTNAVDDRSPAWSPDGAKIAWQSDLGQAGWNNVFTMDADGSSQANVSGTTGVSNLQPGWSPDSTRIVFTGNLDGQTTSDYDVYHMLAGGTDVVRLTTSAGVDSAPHWSPLLPVVGVATTLSVGNADVNDTGTAALTVSNTGSADLLVSGITSDSALFSGAPVSFTVPAGGTQDVTVTFSPTAMGAAAGNLTITHNAIAFAQSSTATVAVDGNGVVTPRSGDLATTTIAYGQGDFNLATISYDGTVTADLTPDGAIEYNPDWSPDGTKIAFESPASGVSGLFVMNPDGTGVVALTPGLDESESCPAWSPDGSRIAFSRNIIATTQINIYTMAADGSDVVAVTTDGGVKGNVDWSPDGARLVYQRRLTATSDSNEIYVINVDGTGEVRLTDNAFEEGAPKWSPDGAKIAYMSDVLSSGAQEIFVMDPDGANQTNLTNDAVFDGNPAWSPDGTRIVFRSKRDAQDKPDLYHMAADGTNVVRLTTSATDDTSPSWGPFPSTATVTAVDTQGQVGRVATVPINITDVRGLDLTGVTITLTYDPAIITPTDDGANTTAVTAGAMVPAAWGMVQNVVTPGTLSFAMAGGFDDPITGVGGGVLATVAFDVSASATVDDTSALTIAEANLNEGGVTSTSVSGTLTVVTLMYGDVTGNGDVTAFDASWVLEYVAKDMIGQTTTFPIETSAPTWAAVPLSQADAVSVADVDANDIVQSMDASLILQHDVDIITTFPADSPAAPSRAVSQDAYQLTANATSERPDARITVSLDASGIDDLFAGELALEFDAKVVRPVTVYLERKSKGGKPPLLVHAEDEGRLGVAFASAKPIAASDATLNVVFEPLGSLDGPVDGTIRSSRLGLNATRLDPSFEFRFHIEPFRFQALANYPNPFNPETWIPFELNEDSDVTIHIYGLDGQRVRTLEIGSRAMGVHAGRDAAAYWDGRNELGEAVSSGVYVYELRAGAQRAMRRMVVLK